MAGSGKQLQLPMSQPTEKSGAGAGVQDDSDQAFEAAMLGMMAPNSGPVRYEQQPESIKTEADHMALENAIASAFSTGPKHGAADVTPRQSNPDGKAIH